MVSGLERVCISMLFANFNQLKQCGRERKAEVSDKNDFNYLLVKVLLQAIYLVLLIQFSDLVLTHQSADFSRAMFEVIGL